jgi:preprotein translocase subunit SecG
MTTLQLIVVTCLYVVELLAVIYFTRATSRRLMGAFAGGAAAGCFGMVAIVLGNALELWRVPIATTTIFLVLFYLGLSISLTPIYLITWRLARRFGWHGLAVFTCLVAIIGPPRDYMFAKTFPAWMVFAPGVAPILADGATYIGLVIIGHAVMSLTVGQSHGDRLRNES